MTQWAAIGLRFFAVLLFCIGLLVYLDIIPLGKPERTVILPVDGTGDWKCTVNYSTETVMAVDEPIDVCIKLNPGDNSPNEPKITLPSARINGEIAEIDLKKSESSQFWIACETVVFGTSGVAVADYDFEFGSSKDPIGDIAPHQAYQQYRTNQYILLFSIASTILAAVSLSFSFN